MASGLTAAELDAMLTEGEARLAQIVANREVVEGIHEKGRRPSLVVLAEPETAAALGRAPGREPPPAGPE